MSPESAPPPDPQAPSAAQAAIDSNTEVVIEKDSSVPHERLREVVDRAKASGLARVTVK